MGRQHQGMDRLEVQQVPEGSGEQGKMEKTGCKIICGAPTMMMMMMVILSNSCIINLDPSVGERSVKTTKKILNCWIEKAVKILRSVSCRIVKNLQPVTGKP